MTRAHLARRTLLAGGAAATGVPLLPRAAAARPSLSFANGRWLGTAGWDVRTPTTRILVDPYLTRFDTGLAAGRFDPATSLSVSPEAIEAALGSPGAGPAIEAVLVTHTHWDHVGDVPRILTAYDTRAFTTLTGHVLGQAMGAPASRLATVKGGEELRLGDLVVRVVPSLHSRSTSGGVLFPGLRTESAAPPRTIADLPEGDTLSFLLRSPRGTSALLLGASDYDDRALAGLRPDVVALPVPSSEVTADYVGRLMDVLDAPPVVVPVHWDDFESPLRNPPRAVDAATRDRLEGMVAEVRQASPRTRVVLPRYLEPIPLL